MQRFIEHLERWPKYQVFLAAVLLVGGIGIIDYLTGPDLSLFIFYLVPVFLGTWFIGRGTGFLLSLLGAAAWTLADRIYSNAIIPYWNLGMELVFFMFVTALVSALKNTLETEKEMARVDTLTGAFNRRYFMELAESEISRASRYDHPFSVAYFDVDNFKMINDTRGHHEGDELLKTVVRTVRNNIRTTDMIARLGGDEFIVLFPETSDETAQKALDNLRVQLTDIMARRDWPVTFSFGMVTFISPPRSVDHMIKLADKLMYEGKSKGKDTIRHEAFGR